MDGWQAVQNWVLFGAVACGLVYYYYPKQKVAPKPIPAPKENRVETKKLPRKPEQQKTRAHTVPEEVSSSDNTVQVTPQDGTKKRKTEIPTASQTVGELDHDQPDEIDMSTRQFAANMQRARQGIEVKSSTNHQTRVKTVKPKGSQANPGVVSSVSLQADTEDERATALPAPVRLSDVDDMLESRAPAPSTIRITAPERPVQEKIARQTKKEVVETKKQRQHRQKKEQEKLERVEREKERKALEENTRRTAREARGEPARNGIPIAPTSNTWSERNAARDAQLPIIAPDNSNAQLLDTLDTDSTSSSNQGASTTATSLADSISNRIAEDREEDYVKVLELSGKDVGWNEVKSSKKQQKKKNTQSEISPSVAHATSTVSKSSSRPVGFQALNDELEHIAPTDQDELSGWTA